MIFENWKPYHRKQIFLVHYYQTLDVLRPLGLEKLELWQKISNNCSFCPKNAKIRDVKTLKTIPLPLDTMKKPIIKP